MGAIAEQKGGEAEKSKKIDVEEPLKCELIVLKSFCI